MSDEKPKPRDEPRIGSYAQWKNPAYLKQAITDSKQAIFNNQRVIRLAQKQLRKLERNASIQT